MTEEMINIPSDAWGKKFLFSVITPVYNTEEYVEETIESVLSQSIGFMENIQLILVNNATTDNAGAICERYAKQYPHNIVYVELPENRGPSGARNAGIPYVRGKYVNFLDSDDKWDENAFKHIYSFLEKHSDEISLAVCRMQYFDARTDWSRFDYKFKQSMVCDIKENPSFMQFNGSSVVLKRELLEKHRFDESSKFAEDLKFVSELILDTQRHGIIREAIFYYRSRQSSGNSQMQVKDFKREWYMDVVPDCYQYLIQYSKKTYGEVIPYVQYVLMMDMRWRVTQKDAPACLSDDELSEYISMLKTVVDEISDYIILSQPELWKEYKVFCLQMKYGADVLSELELRKRAFYFRNIRVFSLEEAKTVTLLEHTITDGKLRLEVQLNIPLPAEEYEVFFLDSQKKKYPLQIVPGNRKDQVFILSEPYVTRRRGIIELELPGGEELVWPVFQIRGIQCPAKLDYAPRSKFGTRLKARCCMEKEAVLIPEENGLRIVSTSKKPASAFESAIRKELWTAGHKRGLAYRVLAPWLRRGKKSWILYLNRTPNAPEDELELRKAAIEAALRQKGADVPVWLVCPEEELEWASRYATPVEPSGWNWARTVFSAEAVLSFNWDQTEVFGWHTDLVRDLLTHRRVDLNDFL